MLSLHFANGFKEEWTHTREGNPTAVQTDTIICLNLWVICSGGLDHVLIKENELGSQLLSEEVGKYFAKTKNEG